MILLPYIISFLLGTSLLLRLLTEPKKLSYLFFPLALGLGLGLSGLLTFYSFLLWNKFSPGGIFLLHLLCFLILTVNKKFKHSLSSFQLKNNFSFWLFWLFAIVAEHFIFILAQHHPFGEWDGWTVWNLKTKFLVEAGADWHNIFQLHWHTQPDYPWLLPCINAWAYTLVPSVNIAAQSTAIVFSANTVLLVFAGLRLYLKETLALLAAALLLTNPYFTFMGTSQYADIILAFYLLMAVILLKQNMFSLLGITLGLMSFAKNEGFIMALIFLAVILIDQRRQKIARELLIPFAMTAVAMVIFKIMAPVNRDITLAQVTLLPSLISWERCQLIIQHFFRALFEREWSYIWGLLILMALANIKKLNSKENRPVFLFFLAYAAVLFVIYLMTVNFDLAWRLSRTASRILLYLLPSALFMGFYVQSSK